MGNMLSQKQSEEKITSDLLLASDGSESTVKKALAYEG